MIPERIRRSISEQVAFLKQLRCRFKTTGAIAPSSRFLADALTGPLAGKTGPVRVLEVGPGTGAVTRRIVQLLGPDDRLDLVELNEQFAAILQQRFRDEHPFRDAAVQSQIHLCSLQEFQPDGNNYDCIISGLPLNNFSAEVVREIFDACFRLLVPGGVLSYFEYIGLRRLRCFVTSSTERRRLKTLDEVLRSALAGHGYDKNRVLANLPPAWVHHLKDNNTSAKSETVAAGDRVEEGD